MAGLSGNINLQPLDSDLNEAVTATIVSFIQARDLTRVSNKLKKVLWPKATLEEKSKELQDWDLWGPLFVCLTLALILSGGSTQEEASLIFGVVFMVVWLGAAVVTFNAQLLGGSLSFFQSVCLLGYCVFPMAIAATILMFGGALPMFFKGAVVGLGVVWSIYSSVEFMTHMVPEKRKVLAAYPVILFFLFLGWFILVA